MENQEVNLSNEVKVTKQTKTLKLARGCALSAVLFCVLSVIIATIFSDDKDEVKPNIDQIKIETNVLKNDSVNVKIIKSYKSEIEIISKSLTTKYDDFEDITWYSHKNEPKYSNTKACYLYIGSKNNNFWGRLVVRYSGEDWIFVKRIIVKCDEIRLNLNSTEVKRDNSSGDVWEWIDIPFGKNEEDIILCIINSKETKIRFEGDKYSKDYTLSNKEKNALIDMYKFLDFNNEIVLLEAK
jgi:hypothetical protein